MSDHTRIADNPERYYQAAVEAFGHLVEQVSGPDSAHSTFDNIESLIQTQGMEVLRLVAQGHLDQRRSEENERDHVVGDDNEIRTHHKRDSARQIESIFGGVEAHRCGYRGPGLDVLYPLDAELNLPPDKYSQGLRREIAHLLAVQSFDETKDDLQRRGGGLLPKRQLQSVAAHLVQDFATYYEQPFGAPIVGSDKILVITADAKGIVVHNQDLREATRKAAEADQKKKGGRLQPGEKKNRKRMATVVSVHETGIYNRTPEEVMIEEEDTDPRPKPENKRVWASVTDDMGEMIEQGFLEALRRDPHQLKPWVVLIDGQADLIRQIEKQAEKHQVEVTITQDFIHVVEYLWKAAHALHSDDAEQREEWVRDRSLELLRGHARNVASGLRRAATRSGLSEQQRKPVDTAANYIENSQSRLKYDESLSKGFPIATGVIEGACRHLVKDRMDLTGARWRLTSAEAVLKLRSLKSSGALNDYLEFHFLQEKERNYPWMAANDSNYTLAA